MKLSILLIILHILDIGLPAVIAGIYFQKIFHYKHSALLFNLYQLSGMVLVAFLPKPVRLIVFLAVFFTASLLFFEGALGKKIYHVLQFTFSYIICEYGYALTVEKFHSRFHVTTTDAAIHQLLLYLLFSVIVLGFFELQLHLFLKKSLEMTTSLYISMIPMLVISLVLTVISLRMSTYEFNMILFFGLILINLSIMYLYRILVNTSQEMAEEKLMIQEHKYFQQKLQDEKTLRKLRHDMKNILLSVQADILLEDYKCASKKLDKLTYKITSTNHDVTGMKTLDVILSPKIDCMNQNQISFHSEFSLHDETPLRNHSLDLAIILGNLMDNAIEAAKRIEIPNDSESKLIETRFIDLKIKQDANVLTILLANSSHPVRISKNGPQISEKSSGRTGIGIESIRERVSALKGYASFQSLDNRFQAIIQLPLG